MTIKETTLFKDFVLIAKNNHLVNESRLDKIKPAIVNKLIDKSFSTFVECFKFATSIETALEFLYVITGKDYSRKYFIDAYPVFLAYQNELQEILKMFKDINDEMPAPKRLVKTLEEFGFRNIISFVADGDVLKYDEFYNKSVGFIYLAYREKSYKLLNEIAQYDVKDS